MTKVVQFDGLRYRRRECQACGERWTTYEIPHAALRPYIACGLDWSTGAVDLAGRHVQAEVHGGG